MQPGRLLASNGSANDFFGSSVAVSNNQFLIGAPGDMPVGVLNQGSAYIFVNPSGALNQVEGSVIDALGMTLGQAITLDKGRVVEGIASLEVFEAGRRGGNSDRFPMEAGGPGDDNGGGPERGDFVHAASIGGSAMNRPRTGAAQRAEACRGDGCAGCLRGL